MIVSFQFLASFFLGVALLLFGVFLGVFLGVFSGVAFLGVFLGVGVFAEPRLRFCLLGVFFGVRGPVGVATSAPGPPLSSERLGDGFGEAALRFCFGLRLGVIAFLSFSSVFLQCSVFHALLILLLHCWRLRPTCVLSVGNQDVTERMSRHSLGMCHDPPWQTQEQLAMADWPGPTLCS